MFPAQTSDQWTQHQEKDLCGHVLFALPFHSTPLRPADRPVCVPQLPTHLARPHRLPIPVPVSAPHEDV